MSITGMTGFGRAEGRLPDALSGQRWVWEARSVNGRNLDLKLRLPAGWEALEQGARALAASRFKRGSLQAGLSLTRDTPAAAPARIDADLLERLLAAGGPHIAAGRVEKPRWDGLLQVRGVVLVEDAAIDESARSGAEAALLDGLDQALAGLAEARAGEGRALAAILGTLAQRLETLTGEARAKAGAGPQLVQERIKARLAALAPEVRLDPQRLAQEAALAAMRADVQEELDRLSAHAGELRALLASPEPAGRRLDFLGQELTREANTLCSKSQDLALTRIGLDLKATVDQIKEQAANVE